MAIIGRKDEKEIFTELLQSSSSEFIAVYGRRRVGKTFLIRTFFEQQLVFDCSGINGENQATQLENFTYSLKEYFPKHKKTESPATWLQVFNLLKERINSIKTKKKKVIFLDELPWYTNCSRNYQALL